MRFVMLIKKLIAPQKLAARLGLEPRQNESESFVLPLHHRAVKIIMRFGRICSRITDGKMEPAMGFEPATACLQNRCSTVELRRRGVAAHKSELNAKNRKWWLPGDSNPEPID
jgi:hypothetical protein